MGARWFMRSLTALVGAALIGVTLTAPAEARSVGEPPGSIGLTPGPGRVTLTWPDPGYSPGYIASIKVEAQPGPQSCTSAIDGGGCTVTGLENGRAYTFAVYAIGLSGFTYEPAIVGPVWPCCSVPAAPARVSAEAQQGSAVVSWEPPTNAQAAGNTFTYSVTSTPAAGSCSTAERSCLITGLEDGTGYSFQVKATNSLGTGPPATSPEVQPIGPPGAPSGVQVFLGDKGTATVSWVGPAKTGGLVVDRYVATASPGGASCETTGTLSCTVAGLSNGERYRFSVTAANTAGAGPASPSSAVARPLAGPGRATAVKARLAGGRAVVTWTPPRSTGGLPIRDYIVRSSPAGASCRTSGTTCTVGDLRAGTRYVFTVQARNAKGLGLVAQSSGITTPAPAVPTPVQPKPEQELT